MYRARERRPSLQNIPLVLNKGEQVKLERKHRFLEKVRQKETVGLVNKRRELVNFRNSPGSHQPSNLASCVPFPPTSDSRPDNNRRASRSRFSRSQSLTGLNTIPPITLNNNAASTSTAKNRRPYCIHTSLSKSFDSSRACPRCWNTTKEPWSQSNASNSDSSEGEEMEEDVGGLFEPKSLREILPPPCLAPLYTQNARSLKEKSKSREQRPDHATSCNLNDLYHCRYLRSLPQLCGQPRAITPNPP